jgi:hypothetical protein
MTVASPEQGTFATKLESSSRRTTKAWLSKAWVVGQALTDADRTTFIATASLHDIRYAPPIQETDFHPLLSSLESMRSPLAGPARSRRSSGPSSPSFPDRPTRSVTHLGLTRPTHRELNHIISSAEITITTHAFPRAPFGVQPFTSTDYTVHWRALHRTLH